MMIQVSASSGGHPLHGVEWKDCPGSMTNVKFPSREGAVGAATIGDAVELASKKACSSMNTHGIFKEDKRRMAKSEISY